MAYMVKFEAGTDAYRFDTDPLPGETIVASAPVAGPAGEYEIFSWDTLAYDPMSATEVEALLLTRIDVERDRRAAAELDQNAARANEYTIKLIEALSDIGPWPWIEDLAVRKGTDVETERLLILVARDEADAKLRAIAGVAVATKAAIRAAGSVEDKTAIYESIAWPTT